MPRRARPARTSPKRFSHDTIAIVYDFDGTLTPEPMQNRTVLEELGINPARFWDDVNAEVARTGGDQMLTYMRLLTKIIDQREAHVSRARMRDLARRIEYFPGVESWFARTNDYVRRQSGGRARLRHYLVSAGLAEILDGVSIKRHFTRIYASQYYFDHHERATFPTVVINDTAKTQYLFRINKGRETPGESINTYMPEFERPIPFAHMLYIGDGMTDVPSMTVTKKNGGYAIAVHPQADDSKRLTCQELARAQRIDYFAPADYRARSTLERRVRVILDLVVARIEFERERHGFLTELSVAGEQN
jgi:phosphoserine phosphatase